MFFHTALLHYELYRAYFPLWALGAYETRRLQRSGLIKGRRTQGVPNVELPNRMA